MARAVAGSSRWSRCVVLPPAIWLTRRVAADAPRDHRRAAARAGRPQRHHRGGRSRSAACSSPRPWAPARRWSTGSPRRRPGWSTWSCAPSSPAAGGWPSMSVIFAAIPAVIYLGAGLPSPAGTMTIGTLVAFTALQAGLFRPLIGLLNVGVSLVSSLALFARIFEYLDLPVEVDDPAHPVDVDPAARARARALRGRHLRLPGQRHRRRRRRHAGRPRRHDAGARRRDRLGQEHARRAGRPPARPDRRAGSRSTAIDLRDLRLADLAAIVGVVSQETYLLHTTVRENLRYARPDATDAEIEDGRPRRADPRPDREPARRLRHRRRLARPPVLRRREAAHRDRPHAAARPAGAGARRGDQRPGHRDRARRAARLRRARPRAAPRSPSRTGSRPSATPTRSRCSTTAGSSSRARTTRSLADDGRYADPGRLTA